MSDNIPFEIQEDIIKRVVPVRSLLCFRSVSKEWKSLIDSSEFIAHHHHLVNQSHQPENLLLRYSVDSKVKYVSIVDDDSFPQNKVSHVVSPILKTIRDTTTIDCSHGLVCFIGGFDQNFLTRNLTIILWNPSIRKSVGIVLPPPRFRAIGFAVCPKTCDPKILMITCITSNGPPRWEFMSWMAQVFSLSSRAWRTILMNIHLPLGISFRSPQVVIDGVIYWATFDGSTGSCDMIVSFDSTSEKFERIDLPDCLVNRFLTISKLNDSLIVINNDTESDDESDDESYMVSDVWIVIKNGDMKYSFKKLFTFCKEAYDGSESYDIIGFRKNGKLIRERICEDDKSTTLEVYEPSTKSWKYLGFDATYQPFYKMTHYTQSLLLVNHSDSIIQA